MPIVEFDGPPSWSLNASETGERTSLAFAALVAPTTATADWSAIEPIRA